MFHIVVAWAAAAFQFRGRASSSFGQDPSVTFGTAPVTIWAAPQYLAFADYAGRK